MPSRLRLAGCLLLTAFALRTDAAPTTRTALVIGNAKYEAAVGPLRNTGNDAKAVAKTLRDLGFAVIEKHDVTRDQLLRAVVEFRATLTNAEVGLFYYAGHGISIAGSNYLLPVKSGYTAEGADDVTLRLLAETKLFNVEQAVADMKSSGALCNLLILDACRTTAVARTGRTRDATNPGGLSEMKPPAGSLIAFATDAGQTALDGDGTNGLYTEELLKNLRTPGLTVEQVFKRTRAGVLERSNGGQIPAEYSRLVGDDIFLAGEAPKAPPMATPLVPETTPAPPLPTIKEISKLAAAGKASECVEALQQVAQANGPGDFAAQPIEMLLEQVKEDLREATMASPIVESCATTCKLVLNALRDCLPPDHAQKITFTAKALNRRGDALLLLGRADEALDAYNTALPLTPDDSYILYNRGRAHLALGSTAEATADFTSAASDKFKHPGAKKLATAALAKLK
ncbi:caspase family protein [Prosthecobacter sp.]|uniref:caspase family protein n=1 Tax=Prosthecobacter sp. TaxID=1965333 RepID=UPI002489F3A7|nr:caspase family protein [Prosthecobacter sp.]MDI1311705.1 caspase family protein [Prosthecobacter sp.]